MQLQNKHDTDDSWIYERNPDTGEIFRRKYGDYASPRECINPAVNAVPNTKDVKEEFETKFIDYEAAALHLKGAEWNDFINSLTNEQKIQLSRCWD